MLKRQKIYEISSEVGVLTCSGVGPEPVELLDTAVDITEDTGRSGSRGVVTLP